MNHLVPCPNCGEPFCPDCGEHYAGQVGVAQGGAQWTWNSQNQLGSGTWVSYLIAYRDLLFATGAMAGTGKLHMDPDVEKRILAQWKTPSDPILQWNASGGSPKYPFGNNGRPPVPDLKPSGQSDFPFWKWVAQKLYGQSRIRGGTPRLTDMLNGKYGGGMQDVLGQLSGQEEDGQVGALRSAALPKLAPKTFTPVPSEYQACTPFQVEPHPYAYYLVSGGKDPGKVAVDFGQPWTEYESLERANAGWWTQGFLSYNGGHCYMNGWKDGILIRVPNAWLAALSFDQVGALPAYQHLRLSDGVTQWGAPPPPRATSKTLANQGQAGAAMQASRPSSSMQTIQWNSPRLDGGPETYLDWYSTRVSQYMTGGGYNMAYQPWAKQALPQAWSTPGDVLKEWNALPTRYGLGSKRHPTTPPDAPSATDRAFWKWVCSHFTPPNMADVFGMLSGGNGSVQSTPSQPGGQVGAQLPSKASGYKWNSQWPFGPQTYSQLYHHGVGTFLSGSPYQLDPRAMFVEDALPKRFSGPYAALLGFNQHNQPTVPPDPAGTLAFDVPADPNQAPALPPPSRTDFWEWVYQELLPFKQVVNANTPVASTPLQFNPFSTSVGIRSTRRR